LLESSEDITNDVLNNSYLINGEKKNEKEETKIKKVCIIYIFFFMIYKIII